MAGVDVRLKFSVDLSGLQQQLQTGLTSAINSAVANANGGLRSLQTQMTGVNTAVATTTASTRQLSTTMASGASHTRAAAKETSKLKEMMQGLHAAGGLFLGLALYRGFGLITRTISEAARSLLEFNKSLAQANSLVVGNNKTVDNFRETLLAMSRAVPQTQSELGAGLYFILSSGFEDASDAAAILEASSRGAAAGMATTESAAKILTSVLNSYGLGAEHVNEVNDMLFQTVKRGIVTFGELETALGTVNPVAASFNIRLEETLGAIQVMTRGGLNASRSTVALRQALQNIVAPSQKARNAAEELGIELGGSALQTKGLVGFFEDFNQKVGLMDSNVNKVIDALNRGEISFEEAGEALAVSGLAAENVNKIFTSRNGLMAAVLLTGKQFENFKESVELTAHSAGTMEQAFVRATDNALDNMQLSANNLAVAFSGLSGGFDALAKGLRSLTGFFADMKEQVAATITTLLAVIATGFVVWLGVKMVKAAHTAAEAIKRVYQAQQIYNYYVQAGTAHVGNAIKADIAREVALRNKSRAMGIATAATTALAGATISYTSANIKSKDGITEFTKTLDNLAMAELAIGGAMAGFLIGGPLGALVGAVSGGLIGKLIPMLHKVRDEFDILKESLEGTAADIEKTIFERIRDAAMESAAAVQKAAADIKRALDEIAHDRSILVKGIELPTPTKKVSVSGGTGNPFLDIIPRTETRDLQGTELRQRLAQMEMQLKLQLGLTSQSAMMRASVFDTEEQRKASVMAELVAVIQKITQANTDQAKTIAEAVIANRYNITQIELFADETGKARLVMNEIAKSPLVSAVNDAAVTAKLLADAMKEMNEKIEDITGAAGGIRSVLEFAEKNWNEMSASGFILGDKMMAVGTSLDEVQLMLSSLREIQIKKQVLDLLMSLDTIAKTVDRPMAGLADAISRTQRSILDNASDFLSAIATEDPERLFEVLAREMNIEQNIDNSSNTNIVIRISGGTDLDPANAAKFADAVATELRNRERQRGGGIRR